MLKIFTAEADNYHKVCARQVMIPPNVPFCWESEPPSTFHAWLFGLSASRYPKRNLGRLGRFCVAHAADQQTVSRCERRLRLHTAHWLYWQAD